MRAVPILATVVFLTFPHAGMAAAPRGSALVIADFDTQPLACFPTGWKSREDQASAERIYRVATENGEQFLHAVAQADSVKIGIPVSFRLQDYPRLSWRWRVRELPSGADERQAATNDSAAGVYVVFRGGLGGLLPHAIKYVWSSSEPRGTVLPSPRYPRARIVVLQSGAEDAGVWRTEIVDVAADYRRLFGAEPPEPQGIAVLTDADETTSRAVADYDDFQALPPKAAERAASYVTTHTR